MIFNGFLLVTVKELNSYGQIYNCITKHGKGVSYNSKKQRKYGMEYKIQAVKRAKEIGGAKTAAELGIPENTMYAWMKAAKEGWISKDRGIHIK